MTEVSFPHSSSRVTQKSGVSDLYSHICYQQAVIKKSGSSTWLVHIARRSDLREATENLALSLIGRFSFIGRIDFF